MIFDVRPSVIGHRGCGAGSGAAAGEQRGYRENSAESFLAAAELGVQFVELDARRSSDGQLVIWHDPATPAGEPVGTCTAAGLAAAGIMRLAELLTVLPAEIGVDIDVKTTLADATDPEAQRTHALVARLLQEHRGTRRFLVTSFDPSLPAYLAARAAMTGEVALGLLTEVGFSAGPGVSAAANLGLDVICLHTDSVGTQPERVVDAAHRAGLEVMTWTPAPALAAQLAQAGVDAVCVDDIPGTQAALARAAAGADPQRPG